MEYQRFAKTTAALSAYLEGRSLAKLVGRHSR
jgi:hypothetical protein